MSKLTFHFLSQPDVLNAGLTLTQAVDLCTESLRQHGLKEVENPPKSGVHTRPDAFIHSMPGYVKQKDICGIKWISGYPENVKHKLPSLVGATILNDPETGFPTALLDATYITAIRTAAVSGVSVKHLARQNSEVLSIIGTGVQGKYNTLCITKLLPSIKKVYYYDTWAPSRESYKKQFEELLPNITFQEAANAEEALRNGDIVVCATGALTETVYYTDWIKPGTLVLPVQAGGWEPDVMKKFDKFVADDWDQINTRMKHYTATVEAPYAELGEIVCGQRPGRENDQERIVNFNHGLAIHDMICADFVVKKAKEKGLGQTLEFLDMSKPLPLPPV